MGRLTSGAQLQPAAPLLSDLAVEVARGFGNEAGVAGHSAALHQPLGPPGTADLLVRHHCQHQLAVQLHLLVGQHRHGKHQPRETHLHIRGASAQDLPVPDLPTEGVKLPPVQAAHGHHVGVAVQQQGLSALLPQPGHNVGRFRGGAQDLTGNAVAFEVVGNKLGDFLHLPRRVHAGDANHLAAQGQELLPAALDQAAQLLMGHAHSINLLIVFPSVPSCAFRTSPEKKAGRRAHPRLKRNRPSSPRSHYLPLLAEGVLPFLSLLLLVFQPNMPGKALITAANTTNWNTEYTTEYQPRVHGQVG